MEKLSTEYIEFSLIAEGISIGIIVLDKNLNIIHWNSWIENNLNKSLEEVKGKKFTEIYPEVISRGKEKYIKKCFETKTPVYLSPNLHNYLIQIAVITDGQQINMFQNVSIIPNSTNNWDSVYIIIEDMTDDIVFKRKISLQSNILKCINEINKSSFEFNLEEDPYLIIEKLCENLVHIAGYPLVMVKFNDNEDMRYSDDHIASSVDAVILEMEILFENFHSLKGGYNSIQEPIAIDISSLLSESVDKNSSVILENISKFNYLLVNPLLINSKKEGVIFIFKNKQNGFNKTEINFLNTLFEETSNCLMHITNKIEKNLYEKNLYESRKWFETTLKSIGDAVITTNNKSIITYMNEVASDLTEWSLEEAFEKKIDEVFNIINEETRKPSEIPVSRVLNEGIVIGLENNVALITKTGKEIPILDSAAPIRDSSGHIIGVVLVFHDIIERKKNERKLIENLKEKQTLLSEIHHRTKNNMQVIMSLLNIHSNKIKNIENIEFIKLVHAKIKSMSLVHNMLYESKDLSTISLNDYLVELCNSISSSYSLSNNRCVFVYKIDKINLNIDKSISIGLVITEFITNALKYAFTDIDQCTIEITAKMKNDFLNLIIEDNGVGFDEHIEILKKKSMGIILAEEIVKKQLKGDIKIDSPGGVKVMISLPVKAG